MLTSLASAGFLATFLGQWAEARHVARQFPSISTAPGGQPATPTVTAGTAVTTSEIPTITGSASETAASPLVLPTPSNLGQFINATEYGNVSSSVVLDVSVNGGGRNKTSPLLYGWMIEDINVRWTL